MNRMIGVVLMIFGAISFIVGLVFYSSNTSAEPIKQTADNNYELDSLTTMATADGALTTNERSIIKQVANTKNIDYEGIIKKTENKMPKSAATAEAEIIDINKKNGDDFEKFVVQKFNKRFFKIKEWAGDKYVNGIYAETTQQPDLVLEFKLKKQISEFAVECKWKSKLYKGGVEIASPEKFKRYQNFEAKRKVPVFIAIGIGGKGASPEQLYIVPLKELRSNFVSSTELKMFQKKEDKNFFFEPQTQTLE